ncbi:MAG: D-alanyl-D-alanine carboxypeptidase/D-alanyl-D-alanine-endopeptidase [Acidobacteriaceae bacterium]
MQTSAQNALILLLFVAATGLPAASAQSSAPTVPPPFPHALYPTGSGTPLGDQVAGLLADPSVSRAHWGVAVTSLDGTPLYGRGEDKFFRPASNNKIFTTATAMALLGPGKTFTTRIVGAFDAATGTVTGNLTLAGGGDANFGADDLPYVPRSERPAQPQPPPPPQLPALSDLASLADQLVAKGVKRIAGDVIGDDTLYPYEPYAESWAQDDQVWGYGAPVSALSIDNNQMTLVITPGVATGPQTFSAASVQLEQNVPYYTVESQVQTLPAGAQTAGIQVERMPGSLLVRVYGSIAADAHRDVEELAIQDPAEYAAMVLRAMLVQRGIAIDGPATVRHRPVTDALGYETELLAPDPCDASLVAGQACPVSCPATTATPAGDLLASHTSATFAEDVVLTNKVSQNLHAELDLHNLGTLACGDGSIVAGAKVIRANLLHAGLDPDDFIFFDGSGLSAHDIVTPRATATFLAYLAKQPWFAQWKSSLPDAGEDGTLSRRFPDPPLKGHLFAKTGTLGESRALSGYLDTASGHTVIFSIFVDEHTPITTADRVTMDKIVTAIAAE